MSYKYEVTLRTDGSVSIESFYKEGELHREGDQPAWIHYYADGSVSREWFYKEGKRHREGDQPAVIMYHADGSVSSEKFYKEGQEYTPNKTSPCEGKTVEIDGIKYVLMPAN